MKPIFSFCLQPGPRKKEKQKECEPLRSLSVSTQVPPTATQMGIVVQKSLLILHPRKLIAIADPLKLFYKQVFVAKCLLSR
jgi:hypothetical protein